MQTKHTPGTRYSNSQIGDYATEKFVHGFQVFVQERSGRESFINPQNGILYGIEVAARVRAEILHDAAPELLDILSKILRCHESGNNGAYMGEAVLCEYFAAAARAAILKATGEQS